MPQASRLCAYVLVCLLGPLGLLIVPLCPAQGGARTGSLAGTVADATGARIPGAVLQMQGKAGERTATTDAVGHFSLSLPAGSYAVTVSAEGFGTLRREGVRVTAGGRAELPLTLAITAGSAEVTVNSDETVSTAEAENRTALTLSGNTLATLSDDDATFQQQIQALAGGGDAGETTLYVDGFSGSRFPPKNAIREIRINSNPFSAEYDSIGFGRIEIFTKPGTDKYHGSFNLGGDNQSFNAPNPFTGPQPPYHNLYFDGNVEGPAGHKTSFFASGSASDQQNNAVVNAVTNAGNVSEAVPNPQNNDTVSARLDRQLTADNVLTGRYEWNNTGQANSGVGLLVLPSEGVTTATTTQTLQLSDTQSVGTKTVVETRFEYIRTRLRQTPNSTAPTINVEGSFSGGGSPSQRTTDSQDHYELQEYISHVRGKQFFRFGGRFRLNREANTSTGGYNGSYTFPSLTAYEQTQAGLIQGASQFTLTAGLPSAAISTADLALYAEDEWKLREHLTADLGLRFESQTAVPDHSDPAPRVGLAYSVQPGKRKEPIAVLRAGYGVFYSRFGVSNLLTAVRQNGVSQLSYIVENPTTYPAIPTLAGLPSTEPTVYSVSPNLRSSYNLVTSLSAEHTFANDKGNISVTWVNQRGVHQDLSRNINAPLPGTYDPGVPNSGVRPFGGTQNLYQFASDGVRRKQTLQGGADLNPAKWLSLWAWYVLQNRHADTNGATAFPSNSYDIAADYGRSTLTESRVFAGAWFNGPRGFMGGLFLRSFSGTPFNITTPTDLNGDTIFNDRPAFATDLTRPSVVRTRFGNFDTQPAAGATIIPVNYGISPAYAALSVHLAKQFQFGPKPAPTPGQPPSPDKPEGRYALRFSVEAQNVTNHTNAGVPVGVLPTPGEPLCTGLHATAGCSYFGQSISLADNYSGITAANRVVTVRAYFSF